MNISKIPVESFPEIRQLAPMGATVYSLELMAIMREDNKYSQFDQDFVEKTFQGAANALGLTVLEKKVVRGWHLKSHHYGGSGFYLLQFA